MSLRLKDLPFRALAQRPCFLTQTFKDSDLDVKEYTRSNNEFLGDLKQEFNNRSLLTTQRRFYKWLGRVGVATKAIVKSNETCFGCESLSLVDEGTTTIKGFMAIAEDEPSMGKFDARSGQWVEITMNKVQRLISMNEGDEMKHVLDYTLVDLHYVENHMKNLLSNFNSLKYEMSSCKSELIDLKNIKVQNLTLQHEVTRLNIANKSLRDEVSDLKKVTKKWTSSKVTLDQLINEQIPGNIVHALGGKGRRKDTQSPKNVVIVKAKESPTENSLEYNSDNESLNKNHEPLPLLPKLLEAESTSISRSPIPVTSLTKTSKISDKTKHVTEKVKTVMKKTQPKSSSVPEKKLETSTEELHLTLMKEVKGLKDQTKPSNESLPLFLKHRVLNQARTNRREHLEQVVVKKTMSKIKSETPQATTSRKALIIPKFFKPRKYYGFNNHHSHKCEYYRGCDICGSIAHETSNCGKKAPPVSRKPRMQISNLRNPLKVDEYSRYTWVFCLKKKSEADECIISFIRKIENLNDVRVKELRCDNGTKVKNHTLEEFCDEKGISQKNSSPCTRKAVNTACNTQNKSVIVKRHRKTSYDVFRRRSHDVSYFHVFGCLVFIHNHRDHLEKFDEKTDNCFFLGYSLVSKAFGVYNIKRQELEETFHVTFNEANEVIRHFGTEADDINYNENMSFPEDKFSVLRNPLNNVTDVITQYHMYQLLILSQPTIALVSLIPSSLKLKLSDILKFITNNEVVPIRIPTPSPPDNNHVTLAPQENWSTEQHILLVNMLGDQMLRVLDALKEEGWVFAMQEELNQFERNKVSKNGRASNADVLLH
ncbi:retrovirus-related pol polyprotein from transposon TNT 1-94 [Tanacetum coccineum]|uniref:Retrovirus-related pol polyprotein from transposon TNT 1-94 n=1 Tax=Tanacetum coccineum TaxID=301880 RepID=A0ABQ5EJT6_9ASTR